MNDYYDQRQDSEYGAERRDNTFPVNKPQPTTAKEKLTLMYLTGTEDPLAPHDPQQFHGGRR